MVSFSDDDVKAYIDTGEPTSTDNEPKTVKVWIDKPADTAGFEYPHEIPPTVILAGITISYKKKVRLLRIWSEPEEMLRISQTKLNRLLARGWNIAYVVPQKHGALLILMKNAKPK